MKKESKKTKTAEQNTTDKLKGIMDRLNNKAKEMRNIDPQTLKACQPELRSDENQIEVMAQKIRDEGFNPGFPIIIDDNTGEVINGELRLKAAQKAGITEIPCICYESLDEEERLVSSCDDGMNRMEKSPMAVVHQLQSLKDHGFSYREIEKLTGISKSEVARKLKVPEVEPELQECYAQGQVSDVDIENFAKDVPEEHQKAVAEEIKKDGGKLSKKRRLKLVESSRRAAKAESADPQSAEAEKMTSLPEISDEEMAMELEGNEFSADLKKMNKQLRKTNLRWQEDPREELDDLINLSEVLRETIIVRCTQLGIPHQVLSRKEEEEILAEKYAMQPAEKPVAEPGLGIAFSKPEISKSENSQRKAIAGPAPVPSAEAYPDISESERESVEQIFPQIAPAPVPPDAPEKSREQVEIERELSLVPPVEEIAEDTEQPAVGSKSVAEAISMLAHKPVEVPEERFEETFMRVAANSDLSGKGQDELEDPESSEEGE